MKKIFKSVVSLALVSVLLFSMSINAFAFQNDDNVDVLVWDNFDEVIGE